MAKNEKPLKKEEVYSVLDFASALSGSGIYSPQIINQSLISLNNSGKKVDYETIVKTLTNARSKAKELQEYSEFMETLDMIFKRTLEYYSNLLSFDLSLSCKNAWGKDYNSEEYKNDLKIVHKFLDNFDYKSEFKKMLKEMLRHETVYTWFRDNHNTKVPKYALQMMPQDYCILTGSWEAGLLYDFDMSYFYQPGTDIDLFDPMFKEYYSRIFGNNFLQKYIPSNPLKKRDGSFSTYVQTSPFDGAWCFKMEMGNFNAVPFISSLIKDNILNTEIQSLQRDKDMIGAFALLIGEMRMLSETKSGSVKDQFAINPKTLGEFLQLVQSAMKKNIKVGAMPTEEVEFYQFNDYNPNMYSNQLRNSSGIGSSASRLIYSADKMSQTELENAILTDYNLVKKVYNQFNNFLNFFINQKTRKFKFNFSFDGSNYNFERQQRLDTLLDYADRGIVLNSSYFASCMGVAPNQFDRMLDEGHNGEFLKNLSLLLSIHTQSGKEKEGRPPKESSDLKEGGSVSRDYE